MSEDREIKPFQNPDLVVLRNPVARAKFGLSLIQQKFLFEVFAYFKSKPEDRMARFNIREYLGRLGIATNNVKEYIREVEEMRRFDIKIPTGDNDKGVNFIGVTLFASVEYRVGADRSGYIEVEVSDKLKPYFLEIAKGDFFYYHIANTRVLKSTHSIKLYLLLKSYAWRGRLEVGLDELKDVLELGNGQYQQYPDFRKRVLERARQEMDEKNDISFTYEEIRAIPGNSKSLVTKIRFHIFENPNTRRAPLRVEMPPDARAAGPAPDFAEYTEIETLAPAQAATKTGKKAKTAPPVAPPLPLDPQKQRELLALFRRFDPGAAEDFVLDYIGGLGQAPEKILDALYYAEKQGTVKNIYAYLPALLKGGRVGEGLAQKARRRRETLQKSEADKRRLKELSEEYAAVLDRLDAAKREAVRLVVNENPGATETVVERLKSRLAGQFGIAADTPVQAFRESPFLRSMVISEFRGMFPAAFDRLPKLKEAELRLAEVKSAAREIDPNFVL